MKTSLCFLFVLASASCASLGGFEDGRPSEIDAVSDFLNLWGSFDGKSEFTKGSAGKTGVGLHIVGGVEAPRHAFPHVVYLQITKFMGSLRYNSFCGGSLISPEWIVTAAHCMNKAEQVTALLGIHDKRVKDEKSKQTIKVQNIFVEEKYSVDDTDIALLKMERPAQLNQFIQPIRLPAWSQQGKNLTGVPAEVIGWGTSSDAIRGTSPVLRATRTRFIHNNDCAKRFSRKITPWRICSDGSDRKGPCTGDSGGPIFITEPDKIRTLVGIVSFGRKECEGGNPAVYTRVDAWLTWINKLTGIPIRK